MIDYLSKRHTTETMKTMAMISEMLNPELDLAIDNVTSPLHYVRDAPLLDLAVVMSLGNTLVAKLQELAEKENEFDLNGSNIEAFSLQLIKSIFSKYL